MMREKIKGVERTGIGEYRSHLYNFEKLYGGVKSKERENVKIVRAVLLWLRT